MGDCKRKLSNFTGSAIHIATRPLLHILTSVSDQRYLDHLQAAGSEFECFRQISFWSQKWRIMPWGNTPTSMKTSISAQSFVKYAVVDELISTELSFKGVYFQICREISDLCISMFNWVCNTYEPLIEYHLLWILEPDILAAFPKSFDWPREDKQR